MMQSADEPPSRSDKQEKGLLLAGRLFYHHVGTGSPLIFMMAASAV